MAKAMRKKWLWAVWELIMRGLVMMFVCWCHCNADKVIVSCGDLNGNGRIYSAEVDGYQNQFEFIQILSFGSQSYGITHDCYSHDIYLSQAGGGILRVDADTMEVETVIKNAGENLKGICFYKNTLFWVDYLGKLYSCNTDGTNMRVIANTDSTLWGIDIDKEERFIYYGQHNGTGKLTKASLDWQLNEDVVTGLSIITAVEVDPAERIVYAASTRGEIIKYDQNTSEYIVVYDNHRLIYDVSLLHQFLLYLDANDGLNVINKAGEAIEVNVTGLEACNRLKSIHVIPGNETCTLPSTTIQPPTSEGTTRIVTSDESSTLSKFPPTTNKPLTPEKKTSMLPSEESSTLWNFPSTANEPPTSESKTRIVTSEKSSTLSNFPATSNESLTSKGTTRILTNFSATTNQTPTLNSTTGILTTDERSTLSHFGSSDQVTENLQGTTLRPRYQVTTKISSNISNLFGNEEAMNVDEILDRWENINSEIPAVLGSTQRITGKYLDMQIFELDQIPWNFNLADGKQSYETAVSFDTDAWEDTEGYKLLLSVLKRDLGPIKDVSGANYNLGSQILSINVFNKNACIVPYASGKLFNITFSLLPNITGDPSCRFLTSSKPREWSSEGCIVSASSSSHLTCSCDHMTSFAVLMQFTGDVSNYYSETVEIFVSSGSIISTMALLIGLNICMILWRNSQIDKEKLLIHGVLMIAMIISYVVTFIWIVSKQIIKAYPICCHAFMIVRYHVFMTMFCATFLEAVHLFRMIILVFGANRSYKSVYAAFSIGFPMLITMTVAAIGRGTMHSRESCWLTGSFIWAFIGPVAALLTTNVCILVIVVRQTLKVSQHRNPPDEIGSFRIALRCAWLLLPMLGVTWLLAPLGNLDIVVAYLFDILTSLQGLYFVFVTCYVNTEVRDILKRKWTRNTGRVQPINLRQLQSPRRRMNAELPHPE